MFDRFDVCEAYAALEADYNEGGVIWRRASCVRRRESVGVQLHRIGFRAGMGSGGYDQLTDNGKQIYDDARDRMGYPL